MKRLIFIILALTLATSVFAQEVITDFSDNSVSVLNEELRKIQNNIRNIPADTDTDVKVKASSTDPTAGYLDAKVDDSTIEIINNKVEVKTITASEIYVTQLSAISADVGSLTAGTITGLTIRTATTGARVQMDDDNFIAYDVSNNPIFQIELTGTDVGDVTLGDYDDGNGAKWDKSTSIFAIEGTITATSGTIGGWDIGASTLSSENNKIILDNANEKISVGNTAGTYLNIDGANTRIRTSDYASGALGSGWNIDNSIAEFNNIRARGKISTSVFEKDTISAVGGNFLVMDADILNVDMTAADASTLTIVGDTTFAVDDILRIKDGEDDEWLKVTVITSAPTYTVERDKAGQYDADLNPTWKKGTAVVNYGGSGEGGVYMTSSEGNSPYIHFFTHAGSPWTTTTPKTRIGNLNGIAGCSGYGIWGGDGYLGALEVIDLISIGSTGAIRSNLTGNYPYLEFSNAGLQLKDSDTGGTYGTAKYGTDKYGYGALVWLLNSSLKIPWVELKEPKDGAATIASMRLYNRGADPTGAAEVGDLAIVNGKLKICTGAGTPGSWTIVGTQS